MLVRQRNEEERRWRCKILIVNPNNRIKTVKPDLPAIEPPLWASLIASYHNADILDAEAEDLTLEQTQKEIRLRLCLDNEAEVILVVQGNNPSVSSTPKMPVAEALADRITDLNVSFTGLHPIAVNYDKYPLVRKPFEGFPMQPWDRLPMHLYRAHMWHCLDGSSRSGYASIYTSLGCPYSCYYCPVHTLYGDRQVRFRPLKDIYHEIDILAWQYNIRNIKIWDELFALREDRVLAICEHMQHYNLNVWCYARLDTITEKMLKAMKRGGINWVAYGFESVTDPKFVKDVEDKIKMTKDAGIAIIANFMFGLPGTTLDDDQRSLEFAIKHLFEFVNFYDAKPYPGSAWYEKEVKIYGDFRSWEYWDQYADVRAKTFKNEAFETYFSNPDYHSMLVHRWGQQAVNQIKEMIAWQK